MSTVGLVVPAYRPDPDAIAEYVESLADRLDARIRIELDAPVPDPNLKARLRDLPASVHAVDHRRGKGAAITAGFEALADGVDVLAFADADGSTPAASVAEVVGAVTDRRADLAVGSRRHPDSDVRSHQSFTRRHLGDGFAWTARRVLDVTLHDYQCGAKAISADAWRDVRTHLYEPGFAWDIELVTVADALGYSVLEVPVTWIDRPDSTVSPVSTGVELARALVLARHRGRRLAGSRIHRVLAGTSDPALVERLAIDE